MRSGRFVRAVVAAAAAVLVLGAVASPASADPGELDHAFGGDGQVTTVVDSGHAYGYSAVVQSDGKLVVAGVAYHTEDDTEFAVVRYMPNGELDPSFGGDGRVVTNLTGGDDQATAVMLAGGGKIVLAGYAGSNFAAVRYRPDGTLDHSFSGDGKAIVHFSQGDSFGYAVGRSKGNKVVVGGQVTLNGQDRFAVLRLTASGVPDPDFGGGDGRVLTTMGVGNAFVWQMLIHADGSIVATGDANPAGGHTSPAVVWYRPNGTLDSDFGDGGKLIHDVGEDLSPSGIVRLASGKLVIVGGYRTGPATFKMGLVRLRVDGQPDQTFGPDALVTRDFGGDSDYTGEMRRMGSKLVIGVSHIVGDESHVGLARLNSNGSADTGFGDQGLALGTLDHTFGGSIAVANGKVYVAGQRDLTPTRFFASRFLTS